MVDTSHAALALLHVWTDFGRRLAVLAGLGAALVSLVVDAPVWVASARGTGTTLVLVLLVHVIARVLAWSGAGDREEDLATAAQPGERTASRNKESR